MQRLQSSGTTCNNPSINCQVSTKPYKFNAQVLKPERNDNFPQLRSVNAKDTQGWLRATANVCRELDETRASTCEDIVLMYDTYAAARNVPTGDEARVAEEAVDMICGK